MKITVRHKETEVIIEENYNDTEKLTTMRYSDQNSYVHDTIKCIFDQINKLDDREL